MVKYNGLTLKRKEKIATLITSLLHVARILGTKQKFLHTQESVLGNLRIRAGHEFHNPLLGLQVQDDAPTRWMNLNELG